MIYDLIQQEKDFLTFKKSSHIWEIFDKDFSLEVNQVTSIQSHSFLQKTFFIQLTCKKQLSFQFIHKKQFSIQFAHQK